MSIQFMENFQLYAYDSSSVSCAGSPWEIGTVGMVNGTQSGILDDPDTNAPAGSKVFAPQNTYSDAARINLPTPGQQIGIAARVWIVALPSDREHGGALQFNNAANESLYAMHVLPTGAIRLSRRARDHTWTTDDTVIDETTGPVVTAGAHYHWEWFMDTATGDYELRIEGVTVMEGTDDTPYNDEIAIVGFLMNVNGAAAGTAHFWVKDIVIWDDTGSVNNDFIGTVTVYALYPTSDVSSGWTPSTGATNFGVVDETPASDTDYISASDALPAASIMELENLPADIVGVRAVQTMVRAKKTDGGDATLVVSMLSNGDADAGASHAITTSFAYSYDVSELDPDTAALWTPGGVNAATIKIDRTV